MSFLRAFGDRDACCKIVCMLYGLSAAITFAEKLVLARDYGVDGWFPWRIFRFDRSHVAIFRRFPRLTDAVFGCVGMSTALGAGLVGVAAMLSARVGTLLFVSGITATVIASLMIHLRSTYGGDGSQQMNLVVGAAILMGFNPWVNPATGSVSLLFIAAQSCLAYSTSGISKLVSQIWMFGDPLVAIFSTRAYGSELALRLVARLGCFKRFVAVGMVLFETLFPVSLLLPKWALLAFLLWGAVFHVSNALFMGLNTFTWSFLATYPAICYTWLLLHGRLIIK